MASSAAKRTALVTGASAGIGRELARVFAENGFDLVVAARTEPKLRELADELGARYGARVDVVPTDLTDPGAPEALYDAVAAVGVGVDVLVNNAGTGHFVPFHEGELVVHRDVITLNVASLTALTRLFLPAMRERGWGRILNVASVASFHPTPRLAVYGATKAYVLSLTEALSVELDGTGVTATALCPGFTDTELVEHISAEGGGPDMVPHFMMLDVEKVARDGYRACMNGRVIEINGLTYRLMLQWERLNPRWVVRRMNGFLSRWLVDRN